MTDSPRRDGPDPSQPPGGSYPGYSDPAYASQAPYGPTYQAPPPPAPTERLPAYSPYGYDPYATGQYGQYGGYPPGEQPPPPPDDPKSPRWLWIVAGIAVLTVVGLVIALVIANSSRQQTVLAPLPSIPEPSSTTPTTTSRTSTIPVVPLPTLPNTSTAPTTDTTVPGQTQTVDYSVSGDGRAINITYVDTGGLLQTEFNVMLPWSKEVQLSSPAKNSASISIINVGREVNCSISINGVSVQQNTGAGLTICTAVRLSRPLSSRNLHRQHRQQPRGQHHENAPDAGAVRTEHGDEDGEHRRREKRHGPAGRCVEAERDPLLALGRHPQYQRSGGRQRRPDEHAQQQPADPERQRPGQRSARRFRPRSSPVSDPTMTGLAPNRSSSRPPMTAPIAATTLAQTPNNSTSACEMP